METKNGIIEEIIFRNEDNGYTVFEVMTEDGLETFVGSGLRVAVGEEITARGEYTEHLVYGRQFQVKECMTEIPQEVKAMERYLGSGAIKGIGPTLAQKIVALFGEDSFRIMEEEPEKLALVNGISHKKAMAIAEVFFEQRNMRRVFLFLQEYELSMTYALRIYEKYHEQTFFVVKEQPYRLAAEINGIGFQIADQIAEKSGVNRSSPERIQCGIRYVLEEAASEGHVYLPKPVLFERSCRLLQIEFDYLESHLLEMQMQQILIVKRYQEQEIIYLENYYRMERYIASKLMVLKNFPTASHLTERFLQSLQKEGMLDETQMEAVRLSLNQNVLVITGGPGTGKTTIINQIIQIYAEAGYMVELAAPTGRAAKRMSEATGRNAKTIHRLLENYYLTERNQQKFQRDEDYPLECDLLIVDEASMLDIFLMYHMLKAMPEGARLILVGDRDQLPSIGAGNILKDILNSQISSIRLNKIYRQRDDSAIVLNAFHIRQGENMEYKGKSDFFFIKRQNGSRILEEIIGLIKTRLPKFTGLNPVEEMQVLTPMRKGQLGANQLNIELQVVLNPPAKQKYEKKFRDMVFREGDKVMQTKNDYQMEWKIYSPAGEVLEEGSGIFNGDIGVIEDINDFEEVISVRFDEEKLVKYPYAALEGLDLAYAMTVHKSQGSEYPLVLLPLYDAGSRLLTRNLLYTAITRAKKYVILIGDERIAERMIANNREVSRYSGLTETLAEMAKVYGGADG
ncbi:ATP-dependent RecD-like DNA helicase [Clostridiales bacterium COT073_COT-073]|nr:ATP-dependent RecD-like DNA helicase [Clostridiales bacterium COT073_COT-073]